ncbi:MAG TPA: hypothetical protein VHN15_08620 [Thermoanaerobaculia bacterium]|nr:hypothetical protein [Thermoanaerobaculia bacterium]
MKKRRTLSAAGLCCLLLLPATGWADRAEMAQTLNTRISLKVTKAAPQEVLQTFGKLMSIEVEVDPEITKPLTLQVEQVTVKTALNATCESVGCKWWIQDDKILRAVPSTEAGHPVSQSGDPLKKKIMVELTDVDARAFFTSFSKVVSDGLSMDPAVNGKLTINVRDRPIAEILDMACAQLQCRWRLATEDGNPILEIKPK